ncbi:NAD-P-binding protein [Trametes versicolor FP-101664 SS1]|uniref:NAD-P-binding protein n=1 Tax=Trametes versicolor (strain FP-101664) TaxID=717944 RepID=UPI000462378F|nr:NAD-P-binding protein [Trametes versicolor FP-101664 SS1]EIW55904.1 NAD-P-binding protein [Trametes versicolor FP-101664 SS1]
MPAVTSGKVLVTGANGYIAVWVVKSLLDAGFSVRGTVRSERKAGHLRTLFASAGDKFEVVIVDDITKAGAFDAHVGDVDAIAHTASPFHLKAVEPDELIVPALQGTLSVLRSAHAHAPKLRRVIVLSSTAAVVRTNPNPAETLVLDESSWNEEDVVTTREKGAAAEGGVKYRASKTLAERAAWDFVAKEKGLQWDLVTLNPPFVFGPFLHEVAKPEDLNTSAHTWYFAVVKGTLDNEALANNGGSWVDVRDIAQAHVEALLKPEAAGNRFIVSSGGFRFQDFVSVAHKIEPTLSAGNTSYDPSKVKFPTTYDNTRAKTVLGIKFRTVADTTKDTIEDFKARGWL